MVVHLFTHEINPKLVRGGKSWVKNKTLMGVPGCMMHALRLELHAAI